MANLTKIWGSREIKQGANPSRRGPRLNLIGVPAVQIFLNGEYFGATAGVNALTATNIYTDTNTQTIAFGQIQLLNALNIDSGSTVDQPLLQQIQSTINLVANGITTGITVGQSVIAQSHSIAATSIKSDSQASQATIGVVFHLDSVGVDSESDTGQPTVNQIHALVPVDIYSDTDTGRPSVAIGANAFGQVLIDGTFRNVVECQIIISGEWKTVTDIFITDNDGWKSMVV